MTEPESVSNNEEKKLVCLSVVEMIEPKVVGKEEKNTPRANVKCFDLPGVRIHIVRNIPKESLPDPLLGRGGPEPDLYFARFMVFANGVVSVLCSQSPNNATPPTHVRFAPSPSFFSDGGDGSNGSLVFPLSTTKGGEGYVQDFLTVYPSPTNNPVYKWARLETTDGIVVPCCRLIPNGTQIMKFQATPQTEGSWMNVDVTSKSFVFKPK